ncbi:FG-GAP repeat domain-containing protein [Pelagicoccus mobilis]|uniref:VCBS repeat-containing protein n=1 Tax=Pelagicoccus mobilis TaxID=415221 RepID=A0A934S0Z2_9BACT|nr:VCBS repeat-containing protein [Pelagicoccus mobilis]MBK1877449.1 VCBS repeat-containing protein [Pelagicoccus mobilis]
MKSPIITLSLFSILGLGLSASLCGAEPNLKFSAKLLALDANEGSAVFDVDKDGVLDIVAGRNWFAGPDYTPRPVRAIEDNRGYVHSNGDFPYDVDGDGWIDVISMSFFTSEIHWYRNPGDEGLKRGHQWEKHLLKDAGATRNEAEVMRDLDGDGIPELVVNSYFKENDFVAWKFTTEEREVIVQQGPRKKKELKEVPSLSKITIGLKKNGHGLGVGDLNGDGRVDVLFQSGWYEQPAEGIGDNPWTLHEDWFLHASVPMLVRDLNGDGRNDFIYGLGHDYGLFWREQLEPAADGKLQWKEHLIDDSFSQPHVLHFADIDGDGEDELITGKRVFAHNGKDPGGNEEAVLYYYNWDKRKKSFNRKTIMTGSAGTGLQINTADLNGDGRLDIVVAGKSGTYAIFNEGRK